MRDSAVYLCEVTYAKQPRALARRLHSWKEHWERINGTLRADAHIHKDWPLIPWVFAPTATLAIIKPDLKKLFPEAKATDLERVMPWLYCTYDRKPEGHDDRKRSDPRRWKPNRRPLLLQR